MLTDFENYLKLNVNSSKTVKNYLERVNNFLLVYSEFNQNNINDYLTNLINNNKSSSTFNLSLASFKKYCLFKGIAIQFPKQRKTTKTRKVSLTRDDIEEEIFPYFDYIFKDSDKRKLVIRFMMLTMLRISELSNLKKSDVNFETNQIEIVNGKGGKNRTVFLHKSLIEDVKKLYEQSKTEYLFDISNGYVRYIFQQINDMLRYKNKLTPHSLRHAGAKYLYKNGISLKILKELLGHESLNTTDIYLDYTVDEMQKEFNKVKYKQGVSKKEDKKRNVKQI